MSGDQQSRKREENIRKSNKTQKHESFKQANTTYQIWRDGNFALEFGNLHFCFWFVLFSTCTIFQIISSGYLTRAKTFLEFAILEQKMQLKGWKIIKHIHTVGLLPRSKVKKVGIMLNFNSTPDFSTSNSIKTTWLGVRHGQRWRQSAITLSYSVCACALAHTGHSSKPYLRPCRPGRWWMRLFTPR